LTEQGKKLNELIKLLTANLKRRELLRMVSQISHTFFFAAGFLFCFFLFFFFCLFVVSSICTGEAFAVKKREEVFFVVMNFGASLACWDKSEDDKYVSVFEASVGRFRVGFCEFIRNITKPQSHWVFNSKFTCVKRFDLFVIRAF
jgi:hypothetical protein